MTNLFVLNEFVSSGYQSGYVFLVSLISIIFGVLIITAKNPVISILFLIGLFVTISIYLMLLGLYFLGLSYLLVYVGAVSILFIFILMLINVRVSELLTEGKNSIPLAIITLFSFNFTVSSILAYSIYMSDLLSSYLLSIYKYTIIRISPIITLNTNSYEHHDLGYTDIASVTSKSWDSSLIESNHITTIGNVMYTSLFIFLIITSLILLLAMVGTIVITVRKRIIKTNVIKTMTNNNNSQLVSFKRPIIKLNSVLFPNNMVRYYATYSSLFVSCKDRNTALYIMNCFLATESAILRCLEYEDDLNQSHDSLSYHKKDKSYTYYYDGDESFHNTDLVVANVKLDHLNFIADNLNCSHCTVIGDMLILAARTDSWNVDINNPELYAQIANLYVGLNRSHFYKLTIICELEGAIYYDGFQFHLCEILDRQLGQKIFYDTVKTGFYATIMVNVENGIMIKHSDLWRTGIPLTIEVSTYYSCPPDFTF